MSLLSKPPDPLMSDAMVSRWRPASPVPPPPSTKAARGGCLVLGAAGLRELKGDATARQAAVDLRVRVEPVVDAAALLLVEDDLEHLRTVLLGAQALADNLNRVDEVGEDGVVHGRQRT